MIINSLGNKVGVSVDRDELKILGGAEPGFLQGISHIIRASLMSDEDRMVQIMPRTRFTDTAQELVSQYPDADLPSQAPEFSPHCLETESEEEKTRTRRMASQMLAFLLQDHSA